MKEEVMKQFLEDTEKGNVIVDFWATWCGPCKTISPILDELSKEAGIKVVKINVDDISNTALLKKFNVRNIPTLICFKDGVEIDKKIGMQSKEALLTVFSK